MFRDTLIDNIEEIYSEGRAGLEKVESAIMSVMGWTYQDLEQMDDSDPDEGFYANFDTDELQEIYNTIQEDDSDGQKYTLTLQVTAYEESVLRDALESYSDPSFTKDRDMSNAARHILRQL